MGSRKAAVQSRITFYPTLLDSRSVQFTSDQVPILLYFRRTSRPKTRWGSKIADRRRRQPATAPRYSLRDVLGLVSLSPQWLTQKLPLQLVLAPDLHQKLAPALRDSKDWGR